MKEQIRMGFIGVGGNGRGHTGQLSRMKEVEMVAVCDANRDRAREVAEEFGIGGVFTDHGQMLRNTQLDAVGISTSNAFHAPITIDALRAGKHVFCEKPPSLNAREAKRMVDTAKAAGKVLMIALNNRFRSDVAVVRSLVNEGSLGEVYYAKTGWMRRFGTPAPGSWFTTKELSGGGPLIDLGVHMIDLALFLMGYPKPVAVSGKIYSLIAENRNQWRKRLIKKGSRRTFDVEDLACAMIRFENGATLMVEVSWASYIGYNDHIFTSLMGTKGGVKLDNQGKQPVEIYLDVPGAELNATPRGMPHDRAHQMELVHFIDCCRENREPLTRGYEIIRLSQILDAIYKSAKLGREVRIRD